MEQDVGNSEVVDSLSRRTRIFSRAQKKSNYIAAIHQDGITKFFIRE